MGKNLLRKAGLVVGPRTDVLPNALKDESPRPKTAVGAMAQFTDRQSVAIKEAAQLKDQLKKYEGSLPTKRIDPKLIAASKWANRQPQSYEDKVFKDLCLEISNANGNIQPIKVRPVPGTAIESYEIVFGHRRHRACLDLGIDVLAVVEEINDAQLFAEMDRENRNRKDLRPYEQGVMYARALDEGLFPSLRKMSEALGVDASNASKAIALAKLPEQLIAAFASPLDLQQAWASDLASAVQKDPDGVLDRAAVLAAAQPKLPALEVFKSLISNGVVSNHIPGQQPITIKGKGGRVGKIGFNPKRKIFEISLAGLDANEINSVESAIKALVLGSPKASK